MSALMRGSVIVLIVCAWAISVEAQEPNADLAQQLTVCQDQRAEFSVQAYNLSQHRDQVEREKAKAQVGQHNAEKRMKSALVRIAQLEKELADLQAKPKAVE